MNLKKVLIITYYWPPSGGAGVQRWLKFVKYLNNFNVEPIVITVNPQLASYAQTDSTLITEVPPNIDVHYTSTSEFYALYKLLFNKKSIPHAGFANEQQPTLIQKTVRFFRSNIFIPDPRKGWNRYAYIKAKELISIHNITTVITTSPPHSTQLVGLKLKKKLNIRWIADLRDPWTDIYYYKQLYHSIFSKAIDAYFEKKVLRNADQIITVSNTLKQLLYNKTKNCSITKFKVIPNGYDSNDFSTNILPTNEFTITYTGSITAEYNIDAFINALLLLKNTLPNTFKIRFVGNISDVVYQKFTIANLSTFIERIKYVEHSESIKYLQQSNLLLLVIPQVTNNNGILTGKLFEYLGSKKTILGIGPVNGDAASIINECQAGNIFGYMDIEGIKTFLHNKIIQFNNNELNDNLNVNINNYSRYSLTKTLANLINEA